MKVVKKYQCEKCGRYFDSEEICMIHERRHMLHDKVQEMWENGSTLGEIQKECEFWNTVPEHLMNVNKDSCFIIRHWQCCNKPAYRIMGIHFDGAVEVYGKGSWTGGYGNVVDLTSSNLKDPRPKEELYVYLD